MIRLHRIVLVAALVVAALVATARASQAQDVYLNEYEKNLSGEPSDRFELYNGEAISVDISGWKLVIDDQYEFVFPDNTVLEPNQYFLALLDDVVDPIGGQFELIDEVDSFRGAVLVDRVRFGTVGGAPAPPLGSGASLARNPDGSTLPPQAPSDDENWWTLDLTPTFGGSNDAEFSNLGAGPLINEIRPGDPDSVEIYNPLAVPADLFGWLLSSATSFAELAGVIPAGEVAVFEAPGLGLAETQRVDLFDFRMVRFDQKGLAGAPRSACFASCPDGEAPSNGYDYPTSGGGDTWFAIECSLGQLNDDGACATSGLEEGTDSPEIRDAGWGEIKRQYR